MSLPGNIYPNNVLSAICITVHITKADYREKNSNKKLFPILWDPSNVFTVLIHKN